jgi:iron complex transport system substrate-binding protein
MFNRKNLVLLSILTIAGVLLLALTYRSEQPAKKGGKGAYPLRLEDSYQRVVTLDRKPERIVSVAPNITEIIFALGKGGLLAGRTEYCDFPPEARKVASIGSLLEPNIEKIIALNPDIVIASTHFQKEVLKKLEGLGVKVAVLYGAEDFEGVYFTIAQVGRIVGADARADKLIAGMKRKVRAITGRVRGRPRPRVYYVMTFGKTGDYTAGGDTFLGKMLAMAGGANVAGESKGWQYSLEKLVEQDPDYIVCAKSYASLEALRHASGYRELTAVKAGKVLEIDNNLLDRQGPRLVEGLETLARFLHPEAFTGGRHETEGERRGNRDDL